MNFHPYEDLLEPSTFSRDGHGRGDRGGTDQKRQYFSQIDSSTSLTFKYPDMGGSVMSVGSRLLKFAGNRVGITDDSWVLSTVSEGLLIDFLSEPVQFCIPSSVTMSDEMASVCDAEVDSLLTKRAISETHGNSPGFICFFFCVTEKNGSWRPIVNLKSLNSFI